MSVTHAHDGGEDGVRDKHAAGILRRQVAESNKIAAAAAAAARA
jgi:hypothetical protein